MIQSHRFERRLVQSVDFNEKMNELETIVWSSSLELTGGGHLVGDLHEELCHALCGWY
jgi:hypothetical protein